MCAGMYIWDTVTPDSCHVLADVTPDTCLEEKILIRWITSALSTGLKKNHKQICNRWVLIEPLEVILPIRSSMLSVLSHASDDPVNQSVETVHSRAVSTKAAFTLLIPLRRCAHTTGTAAAPLQQSKKNVCGCVCLEKTTTAATSARFCQSELQTWLQAMLL